MIRRTFINCLLCACLAFLHTACNQQANVQDSTANPPAIKRLEKDGCTFAYSLPPAKTTLNDPFAIAIDITAPQDATVDIDESKLDENFIVSIKRDKPNRDDELFSQHIDITVEPRWHGSFTLPDILVSLTFKDNKPAVPFTIPEQKITVSEPTIDETTPLGEDALAINPMDAHPRTDDSNKYILIASIAAIAIIALIVFLTTRRIGTDEHDRLPPPLPPHVIAEQQLEQLLKLNLVQQGLFKQFYDRLSEILRDYIEARFAIRAPEQTTEEFLEAVRHANPEDFPPQHLPLLNAFLNHTDLVKYARVIPNDDEIKQTLKDATSFIQDTIPHVKTVQSNEQPKETP